MNKQYLFGFLLAALCFAACTTEPSLTEREQQLIGEWRIDLIRTPNSILTGFQLNNPSYTFDATKTVVINMSGVKDTCSWKLNSDTLTLKSSTFEQKPAVNWMLSKFDTDSLHYTTGVEQTKLKGELYKIKQP